MSTKAFISFTTCDSEKRVQTTTMNRKTYEEDDELIQRAVAKVYGKACHWWRDAGLGLFYGQVVKGSNCITGRVRVRID